MISFHENTQRISYGESGYILWKVSRKQTVQEGWTGDKVLKIRTDKGDYWLWRRLSEPLSPVCVDFLVAPGYVTWELILDGYSESSYSATPRFGSRQAAVVLSGRALLAKSTPGAMCNRETRSGEFCRGMTLFMSYFSHSTRIQSCKRRCS